MVVGFIHDIGAYYRIDLTGGVLTGGTLIVYVRIIVTGIIMHGRMVAIIGQPYFIIFNKGMSDAIFGLIFGEN